MKVVSYFFYDQQNIVFMIKNPFQLLRIKFPTLFNSANWKKITGMQIAGSAFVHTGHKNDGLKMMLLHIIQQLKNSNGVFSNTSIQKQLK